MDTSILVLMVVGFILLMGSMIGLTTIGKSRPVPVLTGIFISFTIYLSVILIRIGVLDLSWMMPGSQ